MVITMFLGAEILAVAHKDFIAVLFWRLSRMEIV